MPLVEIHPAAARACLQTHHGPAPLLDLALSENRVRATLQTRPRIHHVLYGMGGAGVGALDEQQEPAGAVHHLGRYNCGVFDKVRRPFS
jgi:hypothetical protein